MVLTIAILRDEIAADSAAGMVLGLRRPARALRCIAAGESAAVASPLGHRSSGTIERVQAMVRAYDYLDGLRASSIPIENIGLKPREDVGLSV